MLSAIWEWAKTQGVMAWIGTGIGLAALILSLWSLILGHHRWKRDRGDFRTSALFDAENEAGVIDPACQGVIDIEVINNCNRSVAFRGLAFVVFPAAWWRRLLYRITHRSVARILVDPVHVISDGERVKWPMTYETGKGCRIRLRADELNEHLNRGNRIEAWVSHSASARPIRMRVER